MLQYVINFNHFKVVFYIYTTIVRASSGTTQRVVTIFFSLVLVGRFGCTCSFPRKMAYQKSVVWPSGALVGFGPVTLKSLNRTPTLGEAREGNPRIIYCKTVFKTIFKKIIVGPQNKRLLKFVNGTSTRVFIQCQRY